MCFVFLNCTLRFSEYFFFFNSVDLQQASTYFRQNILELGPGIIHKGEAWAALLLGIAASPKCLIFATSLMLYITSLGLKPIKPST